MPAQLQRQRRLRHFGCGLFQQQQQRRSGSVTAASFLTAASHCGHQPQRQPLPALVSSIIFIFSRATLQRQTSCTPKWRWGAFRVRALEYGSGLSSSPAKATAFNLCFGNRSTSAGPTFNLALLFQPQFQQPATSALQRIQRLRFGDMLCVPQQQQLFFSDSASAASATALHETNNSSFISSSPPSETQRFSESCNQPALAAAP